MTPTQEPPSSLLARFHAAQNDVYAGGDPHRVAAMLAPDVVWSVPGDNAIAGIYRGIDQTLDYFSRRRTLAGNSLRLHPGEILRGEGSRIAQLIDGTATLGGAEHRWSTVGLYEFTAGRIRSCHLLPLDPAAFDLAWSDPDINLQPHLPLRLGRGERIRAFTGADAEALQALVEVNRPRLSRWFPWAPTQQLADTQAFIDRTIREAITGASLQCALEVDGRIAGSLGFPWINDVHRKAEIGYWIDGQLEGRGLATRACGALLELAFGPLQLNRVEIRAAPENTRSCAVAERLGFTREGIMRASFNHLGKQHDDALYALLAGDWAAQPARAHPSPAV